MSDKPKPSALEQLDLQPCPTCNTTSKRSLVVCIDGTSNQFSVRNTNVVELYSRLIKNEDQRTFYNSGIGTYAKPHGLTFRQWIANKRDLALAWQFDKILLSAYLWLSENYESGDRIFLFGFSRGAYQVRALSAMIRDVGLIHKGNQDQIPFAYKLYADPNSREVSREPLSKYESVKSYLYRVAGKKYPLKPGSTVDLAARFKTTFSRQDVKVHFVGVWDTVSSVGLVYGKTLPGTTDGMEHACFFRHALAIHERRVKFLPEFADSSRKTGAGIKAASTNEGDRSDGGAGAQHARVSDGPRAAYEGPSIADLREPHNVHGSDELSHEGTLRTDVPKEDATLDPQQPHIKEVWFAGSHSDIGGGNVTNLDLDRFGPSQRWMSFESMLAGLKLGDDPRKWEGDPKTFKPYESLTGAWWILELFPVKQLSFLDSSKRDETVRRWRRAFAAEEDQKFHETALEVIGRDCLPPKAEKHLLAKRERDPPGEVHSNHAYGPDLKLWPDLDIESDPYYNALSFLRLLNTDRLTRASDIEWFEQVLAHASATPAGQRSIRDAIQELVEQDVRSTRVNDNGKGVDDRSLQYESRGRLLSKWGSILLRILQEWDTKARVDPACTRTLRAVFGLFKHLTTRLSFPQSRELRLRAKTFAQRNSPDSENFLLLVNSVFTASLDVPRPALNVWRSDAEFGLAGKRVIVGFANAGGCVVVDCSGVSPPLRLAEGDSVFLLAVSGDGAFVGVALGPPRKGVITIWNVAAPGNEPVHIIEDIPTSLKCLALNHDGTRFVAACGNGEIIVWTEADGCSPFATFDFPYHSICIAWSCDNYVAAVSYSTLHIWDMSTAPVPTRLLPATNVGLSVKSIAFAPTTTEEPSPIRIVAGGSGIFRLDVVKDGAYRVEVTKLSHMSCTDRVCFSPDGKHIASIGAKVSIWDADSCETVCDDIDWHDDHNVRTLSFEEDDTAVRVFCTDESVRLFCWK